MMRHLLLSLILFPAALHLARAQAPGYSPEGVGLWPRLDSTLLAAPPAPGATSAPQVSAPSAAAASARALAAQLPADARGRMETAYRQSMDVYLRLEKRLGLPPRDLAGSLAAFIVGNHMVAHDTEVSDEAYQAAARQLGAQPALRALARRLDPAALRDLYEQSAMAGTFMAMAQKSARPSSPVANALREAARANLGAVLGTDPAHLRIGAQGLALAPPSAPLQPSPAAPLPGRLPGKLLVEDGSGGPFTTHLIDLASGMRRTLPRSRIAQERNSADRWQAGHGGAILLRSDPLGNLALVDPRTLREAAVIDLPTLRKAGLDPEFRSAFPAPDGKLLLGYWNPNGRGKPGLYVIKPTLEPVDTGSPLRYPTEGLDHALDWLPDGRYVYLAGTTLVVAKPGAGVVSRARLDLPAGVDTHGVRLKASPDGRHVLLGLERQGKVPLGLLYTARLDGGGLRLLARPAPRIENGNVRLSMGSAAWSPDGRWIAFVIRGVNPSAPGGYEACQPVRVLPFDGGEHVLEEAQDAGNVLRLPGAPTPLAACGGLAWLP